MNPSLQQLLQRPDIWRSRDRRRLTSDTRGYATGFAALDRALSTGGWPRGAMSELLLAQPGSGELELLAPLLAAIGEQRLLQVWINPPYIPYAPALTQRGVALESLLIVRADARDLLWACEQALRSAACGAVLFWPPHALRYAELRKLQVAAAAQNAAGFLLRDKRAATQASPAALRLQVATAIERDTAQLSVRILKQRGNNHECAIVLPRARELASTSTPRAAAPSPARKTSAIVAPRKTILRVPTAPVLAAAPLR